MRGDADQPATQTSEQIRRDCAPTVRGSATLRDQLANARSAADPCVYGYRPLRIGMQAGSSGQDADPEDLRRAAAACAIGESPNET